MIPTIGRIVHYTLTQQDANRITQHRKGFPNCNGNPVSQGDVYPLIITRAWGDTEESAVNGQVLLDGNDSLWVTSISQGDGLGRWTVPPRV